ncbi:MAG: ribbon-helix-helix domain-containing protein [Acidimicrobiales bacterium]|nr:ribbon-helix-helix domain-containing protein [Acidimicrobiales bacterium]
MRTTVTLDDDVAKMLERRARERGTTFKHTINEVLRRGLAVGPDPEPYELPTFSSPIQPGLDLTKALALAATLEDDEVLRKLEMGK